MRSIRGKRPSPALVISILALFVALGGTSIAAFKLKANSVGSKQIKPDAATGADVNESTFGKVPSAATADNAGQASNATHAAAADNATHAATADNADTLGGTPGSDFVFGFGVQFAAAGALDDATVGGIAFFAGDLFVHCSTAQPDLVWENDAPGDGFPTDIWTSSGTPAGHQPQADGGASTTLDTDMSNKTEDIEIWTGDDAVLSVHVSVFRDGANKCQTSMFVNAEPNTGIDLSSAGSRARDARRAPEAVGLGGG
jgi:hypothetical protein